eukprot:TRINITY_DN5900_c0_g1_i1.p1 TRINITY_DN5900_c0_g1~~TRINITY_DN5900_c0_g1_i1.p1  ORF type:complete len:250 (-),score=47.91 TRINITY_DN5900_c0_g1_i1:130-879(-)
MWLVRSLRVVCPVAIGVFSTMVAFNDGVAGHITVVGGSMRPTLNPNPNTDKGDRCLVYKWNYKPTRGDIVCVRSPNKPGGSVIKRIIGLEGDFVKVRTSTPLKMVQVPVGQVWLEGDNTAWSLDSNTYGPVPVNLIEGKAVCVTWAQDFPHSWSENRFFTKLATEDRPHRRATDKEFVDWLNRKKEFKRQKMERLCEVKWELKTREKSQQEEKEAEHKALEWERLRKPWEQFGDEFDLLFLDAKEKTNH